MEKGLLHLYPCHIDVGHRVSQVFFLLFSFLDISPTNDPMSLRILSIVTSAETGGGECVGDGVVYGKKVF